jgi:T-box protein 20
VYICTLYCSLKQCIIFFQVLLDVVATDSRRYRYAYHRSSWLVAGKADPPAPSRLYVHPDTPLGPDALRKQVISFEKVKLTNNEMDKNGQVSTIGDNLKKINLTKILKQRTIVYL